MLLILLALPETSRIIVGNGSLPTSGIYRTWVSIFRLKKKLDDKPDNSVLSIRRLKWIFPNPLACLKLLAMKDVAVILLCNGIYYTVYCCIQASLSTLFIDVYGYDNLEAGLIYIPFGIACLLSTLSWGLLIDTTFRVCYVDSCLGRLLDYDYTRTAREHDMVDDSLRQTNATQFPIEKARLRSALYLVIISTASTVAYGWVIENRVVSCLAFLT